MALITTTEELKQYLEISGGTKYDTLKPSLRIAERRAIAPAIGQEFYLELSEAYSAASNNVSELTDKLRPAAKLAQEALANIAMMLVVPRISVQVSDAGLRRSESDSLKSAYQYQENNLIDSYGSAGFDALEDLLGLLEQNIEDFPTYATSSAYTDQKKFFIESAIDFSGFYHIGQARLTFNSIRYIMKRIEDALIKPMLGHSFFNLLKTNQKAGALSAPYQALLQDFIKPAIALLTTAKALVERKVDVTSQGVTVSIKGYYNNLSQTNTASMADTSAMVNQLNVDGNDFLTRMRIELASNPLLYPLYTAQVYSTTGIQITNKAQNGYFGV